MNYQKNKILNKKYLHPKSLRKTLINKFKMKKVLKHKLTFSKKKV